MKCVFARRRSGNKLSVNVEQLFSEMTVLYKTGNNGTSSARSYIPAANLQAVRGTAYILSINNVSGSASYWGIWRVFNGVIDTTPVYHPSASNGGVAYNTSTGNAYYYSGGYTSGTSSTIGSSGYYSMALVQFSNILSTAAERTMTDATWLYNNRVYSSSQTSVNITDADAVLHDAVVVSKGDYLDVWVPDGNSSMTRISGTATAAASHSNSRITLTGYHGVIYTIN